MKNIFTIFSCVLGLLSANFAMAKPEVDESLRLVVESTYKGKSDKDIPFCSASLVKYENEMYMATAKHCLEGIPVIQYRVYTRAKFRHYGFFRFKPKATEPDVSMSIVLQSKQGSKLTSRIKIMEDSYGNGTTIELKDPSFENGYDAVLIKLDETEQALRAGGFKILELSNQPPEAGTIVSISGFPKGKYFGGECTVAYFDEFKKKYLGTPECFSQDKNSETQEEFLKQGEKQIILSCKKFRRHPGGISGGPVFRDGKLFGVASSATPDHKTVKKSVGSDMFAKLLFGIEDNEINYDDIKKCHSVLNEYIMISPLNKSNLKE